MKSLALVLLGLMVGAVLGFVAGNGNRDGAFPSEVNVVGAGRVDPDPAEAYSNLATVTDMPVGGRSPTVSDLPDPAALGSRQADLALTDAKSADASALVTAGEGQHGVITGIAYDQDGRPLPGVTIYTSGPSVEREWNVEGGSTDQIGRAWRGFRPEQDRLADIATTAVHQAGRRKSTKSDELGEFRLDGLTNGSQRIRAAYEGLSFAGVDAMPGDRVVLQSRSVQFFRIVPRLPDGTTPKRAVVLVLDKYGQELDYEWTPALPGIRTTEHFLTARVVAGDIRPVGRRYDSVSKFASEARIIEGEGPHEFELLPRTNLHVTVTDTSDEQDRALIWCTLAAENDAHNAKGVNLVRAGRGRFVASDVPAGSYVLAAGRGRRNLHSRPLVERTIDVAAGQNDVGLELMPIDPERYLIALCSTESGAAVFGAQFIFSRSRPGRSASGNVNPAFIRAPGEYWIDRGSMGGPEFADGVGALRVTAAAAGLGSVLQDIHDTSGPVRFVFAPQCELSVRVLGAGGRGYSVVVRRATQASLRAEGGGSAKVHEPDERGAVDCGPKQPGRVWIVLHLVVGAGGEELMVLAENHLLIAGKQVVTLTVPTLHGVDVTIEGATGGGAFLVPEDPHGTTISGWDSTTDANGLARFDHLVAGRYRLSCTAFPRLERTIEVPCDAVTVTPTGDER